MGIDSTSGGDVLPTSEAASIVISYIPGAKLYLWCPWCKRSVQRSQFNVDESLHELVLAIRFHELESPPAPAIHPKKKEHKSCSCSIL
ncbi:hypothetical protein Chor_012645 [Crotalus horridus]